jgi:adenylate cyclase
MVGDAVNIAARLQTLNKRFGTDILISGTTKEMLKRPQRPLESLGKRYLKGISEEIEVFKFV